MQVEDRLPVQAALVEWRMGKGLAGRHRVSLSFVFEHDVLLADAALGEVDLSEELRARITHHSERLAHYRAIEARDFALGDAMPRAKRLQHLILKKGIMYEEGSMAWAREALEELEVLHLLAAEPTDRK